MFGDQGAMRTLSRISFFVLILIVVAVAQDFSQYDQLDTRFTGRGARESETYQAFSHLVQTQDLTRLRALSKGSPAARLYGAIGLSKLRSREGRQALQRLSGDSDQVVVRQGCVLWRTSVGEVAKQLLSETKQDLSLSQF